MNYLHRFSPILIWIVGLLLAFHLMLASGFERIPGDLGDNRLINYLLEHGYRWACRDALHQDLWSPPFFYPETNVGGYSDLLVGGVPCYGIWRIFGIGPLESFQLCMILVLSLNFWTFFLFLRNRLRFAGLPASMGAFLFAFASPRLWQIGHFQLQIHFYSVLLLYGLHVLWTSTELKPWVGFRWIGVICLGMVTQLYTSFYLGWFLGLGLLAVTGVALFQKEQRLRIWQLIRDHRWSWAFWGALSLLAVGSLMHHYLQAAMTTGAPDEEQIIWGVPSVASWLSQGKESWIDIAHAVQWTGILDESSLPQGEHAMGPGIFTSVIIIIGLFQMRRAKGFRLFFFVGLFFVLVMTQWGPGVTLWRYLYRVIPGGVAIRALVRVDLVMLIPAGIGLASFLAHTRRGWLIILVSVLVIVEQGRSLGAYYKSDHNQAVREIVNECPKETKTFYYLVAFDRPGDRIMSIHLQLDAMWAALELRLPTVNGYSGRVPPGWSLDENAFDSASERQEIEKRLRAWLERHHLASGDVALVITKRSRAAVRSERFEKED